MNRGLSVFVRFRANLAKLKNIREGDMELKKNIILSLFCPLYNDLQHIRSVYWFFCTNSFAPVKL